MTGLRRVYRRKVLARAEISPTAIFDRIQGTIGFAYETLDTRVAGMCSRCPLKKIKGRTILRDLFGSIFSTKTLKIGYFKGLTSYKGYARVALSRLPLHSRPLTFRGSTSVCWPCAVILHFFLFG